MKAIYLFRKTFFFFFLLLSSTAIAQDTFSICAWDSVTGQVGSAGATCIASASVGVSIISDVHPGVGVIHTQAYYLAQNQLKAKYWMNLGLPPQQIIDSLIAHDTQATPQKRQYGIVDMVHKQTAQFTGTACDNYKNHIHGLYYSIQGNTLSFLGDTTKGQQILDSIEAGFLNTSGTLACRLMGALQRAKLPAADVRCAPYNISTFSAILRVANPTNSVNALYLDLYVNTYPPNAPAYMDPIDSLQKLFDQWGGCAASYVPSFSKQGGLQIFPLPASNVLYVRAEGLAAFSAVKLFDLLGNLVRVTSMKNEKEVSIDISNLSAGVYLLKAESTEGETISSKIIKE
jgi:uncharacterized Ntn-hydrolase superfamily protein